MMKSYQRAFHEAYRSQPTRLVLGLMSGTSADAIDAALVEISGAGDEIAARLLACRETPLGDLRDPVLRLAQGEGDAETLCRLDAALGEAFAEAAIATVAEAGFEIGDLDAIGSHGQTIRHAPNPEERWGRTVSATLQIGGAAVIARRTRVPTVSDFRSADVAEGGEGAPLTPMVDWLLLRHPEKRRAIQNLGGIANVTYLPAGGPSGAVKAFDTGPGNMIIDALAAIASGGALDRDEDGLIASAGVVCDPWLEDLLRDPFFSRRPPKSTGRELFGERYSRRLWEEGRSKGLSPEEILATATALTAESIARAYRDFLPGADEVVLGGGGVRNPALVREIRNRLSPLPARTHEEIGWNGDAKEAFAFAVLADRTLQGLPGNLPQVTGARRSVLLGSIAF
jgi:anhydro-N-acetylmuramic acid kinase